MIIKGADFFLTNIFYRILKKWLIEKVKQNEIINTSLIFPFFVNFIKWLIILFTNNTALNIDGI